MTMDRALLEVLNNTQEPLAKRLKLADNVFKVPQISMPGKEIFLLKWLFENSYDNNCCLEVYDLALKWVECEDFKGLCPNDIIIEDFFKFLEILVEKMQINLKNTVLSNKIINLVLCITEVKLFREYFKHNLKMYMKLLSSAIKNTQSVTDITDFLKRQWAINKSLVGEEKFYKYFLEILAPVLILSLIDFSKNAHLFEEISKVFQKSIFQSNTNHFETCLDQYFKNQVAEKQHSSFIKAVMKFLLSSYSLDSSNAVISYQLLYNALCRAYSSATLRYQFFVVIVQLIGFDLKLNFELEQVPKLKTQFDFTKSLEIYLGLLEVLNPTTLIDVELEKVNINDFLRNILKSLIFFNIHTSTVYQIFSKTVEISPLVIEPIAGEVVRFIMLANNERVMEDYENLVISTFNIFAKLHRTEKFVAKMIQALGKPPFEQETPPKQIYGFLKILNFEKPANINLCASTIFSERILQCFTNCIYELASWQVVNLLKTLCYHLKIAVEQFFLKDVNKSDKHQSLFLEIVGVLTCRLLQSNKMADHLIPPNSVKKFVSGLEELKEIFRFFGKSMLLREHNNDIMRTFLNLCYVWGEVYMTLTYYSVDAGIAMDRVADNTYTACHLMYVHPYLDLSQWQLISQRITNFGEYECKKLLQMFFVQKIRAILLFEGNVGEQVCSNVIKTIESHMEDTWHDLLSDKFVVSFLLPKMEGKSKIFLAEHLVGDKALWTEPHVMDSMCLLNSVHFVLMSKISKLLRQSVFLSDESCEVSDIFEEIQAKLSTCDGGATVNVADDAVNDLLVVFKKFPIIYGSVLQQKILLMYLFSLYCDVPVEARRTCEALIIGSLQSCKFQLTEFNVAELCAWILSNCERSHVVFSLVLSNVFKEEESIAKFVPFIHCMTQNLNDPRFLRASLLVLNAIGRAKNSKIDSEKKAELREKIYRELVAEVTSKAKFSIETYAACLKHYLATDATGDDAARLLERFDSYSVHIFENVLSHDDVRGSLRLFSTALHNKQKIPQLNGDFLSRIWRFVKGLDVAVEDTDQYAQLVKLIVTLVPNDQFRHILEDLSNFPTHNDEIALEKMLRSWESILACDINPIKMQIWQAAVEQLIQFFIVTLQAAETSNKVMKMLVHAAENITEADHFVLTSSLIDMLIILVSIVITRYSDFDGACAGCISILEKLLKFRHALIMDRLPPFLQQYRSVLKHVCKRSNSELNLSAGEVNKMADLARKFEKLTTTLVSFKKDMARISLYLIADILQRYEEVNLYSSVKLHVNNCVYSLLSLCDHHAVSYLMRALSKASTEMFKVMYEHYKKYYMFTGKV
ncbi:uncharacterized protein LOC132698480 isoform X2 [Cylas formicarius]|uniref:uncharacterized protein LOC132698480 isoform X2 n=1 Tax=Cylas formicarius TaxID=197179 RepID=UPI00295831DA|nr:uncharacterized protein LOC132698480 isoform X2 [Cylas formicarius]